MVQQTKGKAENLTKLIKSQGLFLEQIFNKGLSEATYHRRTKNPGTFTASEILIIADAIDLSPINILEAIIKDIQANSL